MSKQLFIELLTECLPLALPEETVSHIAEYWAVRRGDIHQMHLDNPRVLPFTEELAAVLTRQALKKRVKDARSTDDSRDTLGVLTALSNPSNVRRLAANVHFYWLKVLREESFTYRGATLPSFTADDLPAVGRWRERLEVEFEECHGGKPRQYIGPAWFLGSEMIYYFSSQYSLSGIKPELHAALIKLLFPTTFSAHGSRAHDEMTLLWYLTSRQSLDLPLNAYLSQWKELLRALDGHPDKHSDFNQKLNSLICSNLVYQLSTRDMEVVAKVAGVDETLLLPLLRLETRQFKHIKTYQELALSVYAGAKLDALMAKELYPDCLERYHALKQSQEKIASSDTVLPEDIV